MRKMSVTPECDLMTTGLLESIACFTCTISLKSTSSCVDTRLPMKLTSDIDNRWQYPSTNRYRLVVLSEFNLFLLLSMNQSKKSLISWHLFSFSCRKALVSWILAFANLRMVNDPSTLAALVEFFQEISLWLSATRSILPQSLGMMDSTWLISFSSLKKLPPAQIVVIRTTLYAPLLAYASSSTTWVKSMIFIKLDLAGLLLVLSGKLRLSGMKGNGYFSAWN